MGASVSATSPGPAMTAARTATSGGSRGQAALADQPVAQGADPVGGRDAGPPAGHRTKRAGVGDVVALVALAPRAAHHRRRLAGELLDLGEQLAQAQTVGRPAADVERPPGQPLAPARSAQERVDEVVDVEHVADLLAVAVDGDRLAVERPDQEVSDPALILGAEL